MNVDLRIGTVALAAFIVGAICAWLVPIATAWFLRRRARVRFVRFVQPTSFSFGPPLSALAEKDAGQLIHEVLRRQEKDCEVVTLKRLPLLGEKVPQCYEMTARVIALLDALGSCMWGCAKTDHVFERLITRSVNHARAAWSLTLRGYYDEALVLIRGVGEIANLLSLFERRSEAFARWKSLDERTRRKEFSPVAVRKELEAIATPIRITSELYGELSRRNVHVHPRTSPQTYDILGIAKGGGYYQDAGLIVCQNELANL